MGTYCAPASLQVLGTVIDKMPTFLKPTSQWVACVCVGGGVGL